MLTYKFKICYHGDDEENLFIKSFPDKRGHWVKLSDTLSIKREAYISGLMEGLATTHKLKDFEIEILTEKYLD